MRLWPRQRVNVNEHPVGGAPEPGGLPPPQQEFIQVWVYEDPETHERFVHPDTVMELLRSTMHGYASPYFCDHFEAQLRRMVDEARREARLYRELDELGSTEQP